MSRQWRHEDYTVGWICALPVELAAAKVMLDEEHPPLYNRNGSARYTTGRMGSHNVVIACLPAGQMGTNSAAASASSMRETFDNITSCLMVGIGGGVPSAVVSPNPYANIRLGDVVISHPVNDHGGVVQYDFGKTTLSGFVRTGHLNNPSPTLLNALADLLANHMINKGTIMDHLSKFDQITEFHRAVAGPDVLFAPDYNHESGEVCNDCDRTKVIKRPDRVGPGVIVHCGTIASGNQVMKYGSTRDRLSAELGRVLCFEMEAAGLMNIFPCIAIRGICDYADSHKNKRWQAYAAAVAAASARELLGLVHSKATTFTLPKSFVCSETEGESSATAASRATGESETISSGSTPEGGTRESDNSDNSDGDDDAAYNEDAIQAAHAIGKECLEEKDYATAEEIFQDISDIQEEVLGLNDVATLSSLHMLGKALHYQGKFHEASVAFYKAASGREKQLGRGHEDTMSSLFLLGKALFNQGYLAEAAENFRLLIVAREACHGRLHRETLKASYFLGHTAFRQGEYGQAIIRLEQVLQCQSLLLEDDDPDVIDTVSCLGQVYYATKNDAEAEPFLTRAAYEQERSCGKYHDKIIRTLTTLGKVHLRRQMFVEAEEDFERVVLSAELVYGMHHGSTLDALHLYGQSLFCQHLYQAAEEKYRLAALGREELLGKYHADTADSFHSYGEALYQQQKQDEASAMFKTAHEIRENVLGRFHELTELSINRFVACLVERLPAC